MKAIFFTITWFLSLVAFLVTVFIDLNFMPGWNYIIAITGASVFLLITITKGFGLKIPMLSEPIKNAITNLLLIIFRKKKNDFTKAYIDDNDIHKKKTKKM